MYQILLLVAVAVIAVFVVRTTVGNKQSQNVETAKTGNETTENAVMRKWKKINPRDIKDNPVKLCDNWLALASGKEGDMNAMTIGWMTIGRIWTNPVAMVYVSPDRYTFEFMERNEYFTITSFPDEDREKLLILGTRSGRDSDKIKDAGLTVEYTELGNPTFTNGRLMIECRKIYSEQIDSTVMDKDIRKKFYEDYKQTVHHLYIGEIVNVYINNNKTYQNGK
jgi:flavin reductase (DIM6/NTAB) family NADH-FMN oxidoreductase RutF